MRRCIGITALFFLAVPIASAQTLKIRPVIVSSSDQVESRLKENDGRASTAIDGAGRALSVQYFASEPVEIFMVPIADDETIVPTDFITFTLPKTTAGDAEIDLTVSPGWHPGSMHWIVNLLSRSADAEAGFTRFEFLQPSLGDTLGAAISHTLVTEPYTPGSYHALRGYRILGLSATILFGVLFVLSTLGIFLLSSPKRFPALLLTIVTFVGIYELRFAGDLLRFTAEHLTGYAAGIYDEAGSVYEIAGNVRSLGSDVSVSVCRDGTNFKEKILRYMVYPITVRSDEPGGSLILVMDKFDWSLETRTENGVSMQKLVCDEFTGDVEKLKQYPDGSILFRRISQ